MECSRCGAKHNATYGSVCEDCWANKQYPDANYLEKIARKNGVDSPFFYEGSCAARSGFSLMDNPYQDERKEAWKDGFLNAKSKRT